MTSASQKRILNDGLKLAIYKPGGIQQTLAGTHPELSPQQLDEFNTLCQAVRRFAHEQFGRLTNLRSLDIAYSDGIEPFSRLVRAKYPWVNDDNLSCLLGQAIMISVR